MKQALLISVLALAGPAFLSSGAKAEPSRQGDLGGGFIEMLMTGRAPQRAQPAQGAHYGAPDRMIQPAAPRAMAAPMPGYGTRQPQSQPMVQPARGYAALPEPMRIEQGFDPRYERQTVDYDGSHKPGTIVIDTTSKFLYLVQPGGTALRYGIGVGRPGFIWQGVKTISRKAEWPDWRPPAEMLQRRPDLPRYMEGGPDNPLGARAMYLGSSLYRIHGTNEPNTIGHNVSSGCIRLRNEDVIDLYDRVKVGATVVVI